MDVAIMTSPIGLWNAVLKPQVRHFGCCHLGFLEQEVTIFGRELGAVEERGMDLTLDCGEALQTAYHSSGHTLKYG